MEWEEINNDISSLENDCLSLIRDIETKELTSQEKHSDIEKENFVLLKEIDDLNKENSVLKMELAGILRVNENLKKTFDSLQENITKSQSNCTALQNSLNINENDNLRMKKAREMLQVGKDFTLVRWDYSAPSNIFKGYIVNKNKKVLDCFELDKTKMSDDKIQEYLWDHIETNSSADWTNLLSSSESGEIIENKENMQKNL